MAEGRDQRFPLFVLACASIKPLRCGKWYEHDLNSTGEETGVHRSEVLKHTHPIRGNET